MSGVEPLGEMDPSWHKRPFRIILVRHGESQGNLDETVYCHVADSKVSLTPLGWEQAEEAGRKLRAICEKDGHVEWKVHFYVSPYKRTLQTLRGIGQAFNRDRILGVREEPRIREQDFGNFQVAEHMKVVKKSREKFGKFFFRFPEGESAADVYDRVTGFLESFWRDIHMSRLHKEPDSGSGRALNMVLVFHGLTMRVFLTRWFKWTTAQFEGLNNPLNCEMRVMQLGPGGEYSLAGLHSTEEMEKWGLSPAMIQDQYARATGVPMMEPEQKWADFFAAENLEEEDERHSHVDTSDLAQCNGSEIGRKKESGLIECQVGYRRQMSIITDPIVLQDILTTPR